MRGGLGRKRVFVDASVVIAAVLSQTGASAILFALGRAGHIRLILTSEVVKEARLGLKKKYGKEQLVAFYQILSGLRKNILPTPDTKETTAFSRLISDRRDRHVLAGAKKYRAGTLVTLDRRHFFTPELKETDLPFSIQLPGQFLTEFRLSLADQEDRKNMPAIHRALKSIRHQPDNK